MATITFIEFDGTAHKLDVETGKSVMQAAVDNSLRGILGDCGGACSCATCHCYVPEEWADKIPEATMGEEKMLKGAKYLKPNSRLGCQISVTAELDGLVVDLPAEQGSEE